jgi:hypothetical protein
VTYSLCPLKPKPEPDRIIRGHLDDPIAAARLPSNACDMEKCAWFLMTQDPRTKKPVGLGCAVPVLTQMIQGFGAILSARAPVQIPAGSDEPTQPS